IFTPTLTLPLVGGGEEYGGQIFNAHKLDVFDGVRPVMKWARRPSDAMNLQPCYVDFLHAWRAQF
ncbi:MAG: hypothetical protein KJ002_14710, partial [Candidatus Dadabacteria bacterium]|nr:hypothetical protein [Candidatus Dadabacteria bacterium]